MSVYEQILKNSKAGKKMLAVLLDPEKQGMQQLALEQIRHCGVEFVFVGGSGYQMPIDDYIIQLRKGLIKSGKQVCPIVLFPGDICQFSAEADALLLLSLISSRDAELLIGKHVRMAKAIRESGIETIAMGYVLVDGGRVSSLERVTGEKPLKEKEEIVATALAGEMSGKRLIYLEAGSGAKNPVSKEIIKAVKEAISVPLIVGGGICNPEQMKDAFEAGADLVVIGNHFEKHAEEVSRFAEALDETNNR